MFGNANRMSLHRISENAWGETPAAPAFDPVRYLSESIDDSIETARSNEVRSDRMTSDQQPVDSSPGGDFNFELSYDSFDDLIEAAMMDTWSTPLAIAGAAGDISAASATSKFTSTTPSKFADVVVGQWIEVRGFSTAGNNGYYRVTAIGGTDDELTVEPAPAADETPAAAEASIVGSYIRNGVTERSFTVMKRFEDLATETFHIFRGMRVGGMSLELQTGSLVTGSFSFMGKNSEMNDSGGIASQTFNTAPSTDVMNAVSNFMALYQDAATFTEGVISSMTVELNNNHREQKGLGVLGNVGVVSGRLGVTLSVSQYFESKVQYEKFKNSSGFLISFTLKDNDGNAYIFTFPYAKYDEMTVNGGGIDTDVAVDASINALRDPVTDCMIQIDKFAAA